MQGHSDKRKVQLIGSEIKMAEALVWHLIRDNNSFLVKRGRTRRAGEIQLSSEPGNLLNVNTFKYSGIANSRTVTLSVDTEVVNDTSDYVIKVSKKVNLNLCVAYCNIF